MSFYITIGVVVAMAVSFFFINEWRHQIIVKIYCSLPEEEKAKVGIYPAFEISLFTCLGRKPSREEMGLRYNEYLYMNGQVVIPYYRSVSEFR